MNAEQLKHILGRRPEQSHKGDYGRLLVIAGSSGMAGAAVLAGTAAMRSGAGLVTFAVPTALYDILQISVPEAICRDRKTVCGTLASYDALVFGPGLGNGRETAELLAEVLRRFRGPMVLDADGLNAVADFDLENDVEISSARLVMTPHPGEASRLLGWKVTEERRLEAVTSLAERYSATVVLKGFGTLTANTREPGGPYRNPTGNPGMATAGSGDVLSGMIGALLAGGTDPFHAAAAGAFIHGLAGNLAASRLGETGMTAMDICRMLPQTFLEIQGK